MYPYLTIGTFHLGTFGIFLWLAAVAAGVVLHWNFRRNGVEADALNVVCLVVLAGVLGAKTWHELQNPVELRVAVQRILAPGIHHPGQVLGEFGEWMRSGIAWFGGLLAGIAMLFWQGWVAKPNGLTGWRAGARMLDLAAPAAPVGYGIGRIGCLTSGDGDYGRETMSRWGVHLKPDALVPTLHRGAMVLPTPLWELGAALVIGWAMWRLGVKARPLGWLTGVYLVLSGAARFCVEFWRINPRLYWGMSNAQVAALGSVVVGLGIVVAVRRRVGAGTAVRVPESLRENTEGV